MINKTINIEINNQKAILNTYILDGDKKRSAVLICPGGGYGHTSDREAEPIAMQFNAAGFHAFVLRYNVAPVKHPQPLLEVSKAMCIIRKHAKEWHIDENKIAVCGFSAGGHLAASLGVHWKKSYIQDTLNIKEGLNRPNSLILCYPVISSGEFAHRGSFENLLGKEASSDLLHEMSLEHHVSKDTPPTFIWHTYNDGAVPVENSLLFAMALRKNQIPLEMHIYPKGHHGLSLATEETANEACVSDSHVATWMDLCIEWLDECAF